MVYLIDVRDHKSSLKIFRKDSEFILMNRSILIYFHRINDYVTLNRPQVDQVITTDTRFLLVRIFRFEIFLIITVTVTY